MLPAAGRPVQGLEEGETDGAIARIAWLNTEEEAGIPRHLQRDPDDDNSRAQPSPAQPSPAQPSPAQPGPARPGLA